MRGVIELSDVHDIVFVAEHSTLVVVGIQIVRCTEDSDDCGEARALTLQMHSIAAHSEYVSIYSKYLAAYP
jgi:hypothetical protein